MMQNTAPTKHRDNFRKNAFEKESWQGNKLVCGIDEVGRGCLAGPLVTAAVILPPFKAPSMLKDSKIMTEQERLKAYTWIIKNCWYGIGIVHHRIIDHHNIWRATLIAMKKALVHLLAASNQNPELILVDAMPLELNDTSYRGIPIRYFNQGEKKSSSIAAASILAKVKRDAMMQRFETIFPGYHLASHKGYSTKKHKDSLIAHQPSLIHRTSFMNNIYPNDEGEPCDTQQTIC